MKKLLLILATISTLAANAQTSADSTFGLNGIWKLIQFKDFSTGQIMNEPDEYSSVIFEFKDNGVNGHFVGHTVSNKMKGAYSLSNGNIIQVSSFGGTKVGEPEWGRKFWDNIYQSSSYLVSQDTLTIRYDKDTKAMIFIKTDTVEE